MEENKSFEEEFDNYDDVYKRVFEDVIRGMKYCLYCKHYSSEWSGSEHISYCARDHIKWEERYHAHFNCKGIDFSLDCNNKHFKKMYEREKEQIHKKVRESIENAYENLK